MHNHLACALSVMGKMKITIESICFNERNVMALGKTKTIKYTNK